METIRFARCLAENRENGGAKILINVLSHEPWQALQSQMIEYTLSENCWTELDKIEKSGIIEL